MTVKCKHVWEWLPENPKAYIILATHFCKNCGAFSYGDLTKKEIHKIVNEARKKRPKHAL